MASALLYLRVDEDMEHLNIGIDVAKGKYDVCILDHGGRAVKKRMRLRNKKDSIKRFRSYVDRHVQGTKIRPRIAIEATGVYFLAFYSQLAPHYEISIYNPIQTKKRARGMVRVTKNDKRDAQDLAKALMQEDPPKTNYDDKFRFELRELCRYHAKLIDQRTNLMKRYDGRVHMLFPLFEEVFDDVHSKTARAIIRECQTPDEILAMGEEKLLALVKKASRGHTGMEKVKKLLKAAEETITTDIMVEATKFELKSMLRIFERQDEEISVLEKRILDMWSKIADQHYLQTIPGIGDISAAGIWSETGDLENYDKVDQIVAMAGIDLIVRQTGKKSHKGIRITKHGSKYLRRYLGNVVISCKMHNPAISRYFKKKRDQGMKFNKARCAASKKLLRQIWFVERNKKPFVVLEE